MRFWCSKGVDGFRVDAIGDLFEDIGFHDEPLSGLTNNSMSADYTDHIYTYNQPENYDMIKQWRELLDEYDSRIIAVEIYGNFTKMIEYYSAGAHFPFNYDFIDLGNQSTPQDFKDLIDRWLDYLPEGAIPNWGVSKSI